MGLDYKIESVEGLDESIASLYEKADDGYILSVSGLPETGEDPIKLKETLVKVREERKREEKEKRLYEQQLNEFKKKYSEIDPDEYSKLKELQATVAMQEEERLLKEAEAKKDWEALQKKMQEKYQSDITSLSDKTKKEIEDREKKLSGMQNALYKHIAEASTVKALAEAKGNVSILKPHIMPFIKIVEEVNPLDNSLSYVTRVVDNSGIVRMNKETGEAMTVNDFINEFRDHKDFQGEGIFERPKKSGGSDSSGNINTAVSKDNPWAKETFNLTMQGRIVKENPALAAKLKAEVGF